MDDDETPEEIAARMARYRKRLAAKEPKLMAAIAQGHAIEMARVMAVAARSPEGPKPSDCDTTPPPSEE